ncbi:MAG: hypothetical protein ACRDPA_31840, partial [Solirubrobacteraceae bacterium]
MTEYGASLSVEVLPGEASFAAFAGRFTGSEDLFGEGGRRPLTSINFITAHDGVALNDLVSYNEK